MDLIVYFYLYFFLSENENQMNERKKMKKGDTEKMSRQVCDWRFSTEWNKKANVFVPQLSLAVMWALILLLTVIFYMELCRLLPQAQDSDILQLPQARKPSSRSTYPGYAGTVRSEVGESYEVIHNDGSYSSSRPVSVPASLTSSMRSDHSNRDLLARSSEMIEEAEKYIQRMAEQSSSSGGAPRRVGYDHTRDTRDDVPNSGHGARSELQVDNEAQTLMEGESGSKSGDMSTSFNHDCDQSKPAEITTRSGMNQTPAGLSVVLSSGSLDMNSYIRRSGALPPRLQAPESVLYIMFEGKRGFVAV